MKFGFNHMMDGARDALDKVGIRWQYTDAGTVDVWTDTYDEIRDERETRDIRVDDSADMERRYKSQATRMMQWPDGRYFFLWRDVVFFSYVTTQTDYRADNPTVTVVSVLDIVEKRDQELWRERLMRLDIAVNRPLI